MDFKEDTPDGKQTLHGTAMVIYHRSDPLDTPMMSILSENNSDKCVKKVPSTIFPTQNYSMPKSPKPLQPFYKTSEIVDECDLLPKEHWRDMAIFLAKSLERCLIDNKLDLYSPNQIPENLGENWNASIPIIVEIKVIKIPTSSVFNSITSLKLPATLLVKPPLIAAPAHKFQTLLTVLKQAQGINVRIMGPRSKTVISLDLGLYKPAKQLQMSRQDLKDTIIRPGELHILMAQLRTIGVVINGSGLDLSWNQADIFGDCTTRQILDGGHVKRGVNAHTITMESILFLYGKAFFIETSDIYKECAAADLLNSACEIQLNVKSSAM